MDINDYVLSDATKSTAIAYNAYVTFDDATENLRVYRYEDAVFSKSTWVRGAVEHLRLDMSPSEADAIADRYDIFPDQERPDQHMRQVRPGNHRKYLRPDVIDRIIVLVAKPMKRFNHL